MEFTTILLKKNEVAKDTLAFYFQKPKNFEYKAGQYIQMSLMNPSETDEEGNKRFFSLASAPYEDEIMITTRLRDTAFKRVLKSQENGYQVNIRGPMGVFTLHDNAMIPAVFLVGGIGITPFRSMILEATKEKLPHKMILFYSNHSLQETAFYDELLAISKQNTNLIFIPIMTRDEKWNGEKGHIDKAMLQEYIPDLSNAIYYSAGPAKMVESMKEALQESGVDGSKMKFENFTGY